MPKRQLLIDAAIAVFKEKGVDKATVSDIVRRAGVAQGTYYLYFPSKLSVMSGIAETFVAGILGDLEPRLADGDVGQRIDRVIDALFHVVEANREVAMLIYSGLTQTEDVARWEDIYGPLYGRIEALLEEGRSTGEIGPDVDPAFSARILVGAVESAAEQIHLFARYDADQARMHQQELRRFVRAALGFERVR